MRVKVESRVSRAIRGMLVKSHCVGKRGFEEVVVADRDLTKNLRQTFALLFAQLRQRANTTAAEQQRFIRPHRPERNHNGKMLVGANYALLLPQFQLQIVFEQRGIVLLEIFALSG